MQLNPIPPRQNEGKDFTSIRALDHRCNLTPQCGFIDRLFEFRGLFGLKLILIELSGSFTTPLNGSSVMNGPKPRILTRVVNGLKIFIV